MPYYTSVFLTCTGQESRNILYSKKRYVESITTSYKSCRFIRCIYIKTTCPEFRLICNNSNRGPIHSYKTCYHIFGIMRHDIVDHTIISNFDNNFIHIIRLVRIIRNNIIKLRNHPIYIIATLINRRSFHIIGRHITEKLSYHHQCLLVILTHKVSNSANSIMRHRSAQLLRCN